MGEEWDARAKEMGFDLSKNQYLNEGQWTNAPVDWGGPNDPKNRGTSRINKMFEEAGGVMDRPEMGAAARYGEGFTKWLGDKGYEVYTEPQQEWMTQPQGLAGLSGFEQDTSGYIPHLSQYAMTGEEMKDPTGTIQTRRDEQGKKHSEALNQSLIGRGIDPEEYWASRFTVSDVDPVRDAEQIASGRQGPLFDPAPPGTVQLGGPNAPPPGWTPGAKQDDMNFGYPERPNDLQTPIGGPTRDQQYQQLLAQSQAQQAGVGALQGPTQKKIQGYMT